MLILALLLSCECISISYIPKTNTSPSKRGYLVMDYHILTNSLIAFGGGGDSNEKRNDIWSFNFDNSAWREFVSSSPAQPSNLYIVKRTNEGGFCSQANSKFYIFAGSTEYGLINDLWEFDINEFSWTEIQTKSPPKSRYNFACTSYIEGNIEYFAVFGGATNFGEDNYLYM